MPDSHDIKYLERTIELADQAVAAGNHPFGALLVSAEGTVLAEAMNSFSVDKGPGHAEANLAREVARQYDDATLLGSTLYTSVEPCSMCSGTIYWANIGTVVFGMSEKRLAQLTGDDTENPTQNLECRTVLASGQRDIEVRGPYTELEQKIVDQHVGFWS